ncbi:MAG: endolytic transglycosylase MltG [Aureispira sp.]
MDPAESPTPRPWIKWLLLGIVALALVGGGAAFYVYQMIFGENVILQEEQWIDIPDNITSSDHLAEQLYYQNIIQDKRSFIFTAQQMSYTPKAGRFSLSSTVKSNRELIQKLRGKRMTVPVTFQNLRTKEALAGVVAKSIQADSLSLIQLFNNSSFLAEAGFTPENVMVVFIPNTYEFYWNTTAQQFWDKMLKEYKKFWKESRLEQAAVLEMTPIEVSTLASIVESESQYKPERPRIAGVYLNRLQKNWKLEADPTVVFAVGDFTIKRVLNKHLETVSPYNTYLNEGLPPGPIYMSSINAIDAVLKAEKHNYMFFCAKPPAEGEAPNQHAFAKSHRAHINNAKKYWRWIRSR